MKSSLRSTVAHASAFCLVLGLACAAAADEPNEDGATKARSEAKVDSKKAGGGILGMFLDADDKRRVVVVEVSPDSPADAAGMQVKDILVSFDGQKVTTRAELIDYAAKALPAKMPGDEVMMVISRAGRSGSITITMPERADPIPVEEQEAGASPEDANLVFCMLLREDGGRIMVDKVLPRSPPAEAGVLPGDLIESVGEMQVESIDEFSQLVRGYAEGARIPLGLVRDEEPLLLEVLALPCRHDGVAAGATSADALDQLQAKVRALQAQIEELRLMAEGISVMIEAMRQP